MLGKLFILSAFIMLSVYSVGMVAIDVTRGEDASRGYFSDIVPGEDYRLAYQPLFGVNTSLSVFFLSGAALLYGVCAAFDGRKDRVQRDTVFQVAQVLFFAYLAADDRFRLHEFAGYKLGMEDAYILLALGVVQIGILFGPGRIHRQSWHLKGCLLMAGGLFFMMVLIDAFMPEEIRGRLSMEDISKLWATAFLFLYAWFYCQTWISGAPLGAPHKTKKVVL